MVDTSANAIQLNKNPSHKWMMMILVLGAATDIRLRHQKIYSTF